jgi:hypothetical protein
MDKQLRDTVFIWPSWISKLVSGEDQCEWKYWFKAHYTYDKKPSDFNLAIWTVKHNALLKQRRDDYEKQEYKVFIEDQNAFRLELNNYIISGKCDLIAINEKLKSGIIDDCKTGKTKTSDHIQVIFYMMLVPKAIEKYKDYKFNGNITYKDGVPNVKIPFTAANDESLKKIIWDTIQKLVTSENNCRKVPSEKECKNCDICKEFCNERI